MVFNIVMENPHNFIFLIGIISVTVTVFTNIVDNIILKNYTAHRERNNNNNNYRMSQ